LKRSPSAIVPAGEERSASGKLEEVPSVPELSPPFSNQGGLVE